MSDWIILRTAGRSTLPLAKSLTEAGYDVWTPSQIPDVMGKAKRRALDEPRAPMFPTYLFARRRHLLELIALSQSPASKHAGFCLLRDNIGYKMTSERSLAHIRAEEARIDALHVARAQRERSKQRGQSFDVGERVTLPPELYPAFAGLDAFVEESDDRHTWLSLGGLWRIEISTFILRGDELSEGFDNPAVGAAA